MNHKDRAGRSLSDQSRSVLASGHTTCEQGAKVVFQRLTPEFLSFSSCVMSIHVHCTGKKLIEIAIPCEALYLHHACNVCIALKHPNVDLSSASAGGWQPEKMLIYLNTRSVTLPVLAPVKKGSCHPWYKEKKVQSSHIQPTLSAMPPRQWASGPTSVG